MQSRFLLLAALSGFTGVAMGAFGAHGLKHLLSEHYLDIYKTAVSYQMWHALLLAIIAMMPEHKWLGWAGWSLTAGILIFSGSLYLLTILNISWLGMITPIGGLAFLAGWALLGGYAYQQQKR
jgi:uncharacterized membrane protein YgdD (TMEM256/DUF423 family)